MKPTTKNKIRLISAVAASAALILCAAATQGATLTGCVQDSFGIVPSKQMALRAIPRSTPQMNGSNNLVLDRVVSIPVNAQGCFTATNMMGGFYDLDPGFPNKNVRILMPYNSTATLTVLEAARLAINASMFGMEDLEINIDQTGVQYDAAGLTNANASRLFKTGTLPDEFLGDNIPRRDQQNQWAPGQLNEFWGPVIFDDAFIFARGIPIDFGSSYIIGTNYAVCLYDVGGAATFSHGVGYFDGGGVRNLDGTKIQPGTINSSKFDAATLALIGTGGGSGTQGPQGPQGPAGATGPQGPAGPLLETFPAIQAINLNFVLSQITYAPNITLDFSGAGSLWVILSGDVSFSSSNLAAGKGLTVRIDAGPTARTISCPATWHYISGAPTVVLAANKVGLLSVVSYSGADANCVATWASE